MPVSPWLIYELLSHHFGYQNWWPVDAAYHTKNKSDPRFEIIIGAILTQNTAWSNVQKVLENLKKHHCFTVQTIVVRDMDEVKTMIQPSGFFNQKAQRLKQIARYLYENYEGNLDRFFGRELQEIRSELLALHGIGPETADSILSYAGNLPIFVVDAYTKRLCKRLPVHIRGETYRDIQHTFETALQKNVSQQELTNVYQELHALIVACAKTYCKKKPMCEQCPLYRSCNRNLV